MTTEITLKKDTINSLVNKELKKNLRTMLQAMESGRKSSWKFATAVYNVINGEEFTDDFKSQDDFAKYIGLSKASISQYVGAVKFIIDRGIDLNTTKYTLGLAYLYSTIDDFNDFVNWFEDHFKLELDELSVKKAREIIKTYEDSMVDDTDDTDNTDDTDDTDDTDNTDDTEDDTDENPIEMIVAIMKEYGLTKKDLIDALDD